MIGEQRNEKVYTLPSQFQANCLIAVRVCLLAIALLTTTAYTVYFNVSQDSVVFLLFKPIAFLFGFCAVSGIWILWKKTSPLFSQIQFMADGLFITLIIWFTGGGMSPLLFLYIPLVIGATLLSGLNVSLRVAVFCFLIYTSLIFCLETGIISHFADSDFVSGPGTGYILQFIGLGSAMFLVAVGTGYLRSVIIEGFLMASVSQQSLEALEDTQRAIVEGVSDGIISTQSDGSVTHVNGAAYQILGLVEGTLEGKVLKTTLKNLFPEINYSFLSTTDKVIRKEVNLPVKDSSEKLKVIIHSKPVINEHGEQTGSLFIFKDITELRNYEAQLEWQEQLEVLKSGSLPEDYSHSKLPGFVGESPVMQKVFRLIERVAKSDASILISGESGTGKELVARAIHLGSERHGGAFVAVNCGAIPENLMESQLFGHKKGSFTGADSDHRGYFQEAQNGTIFLDELGELPLHMQTKLLRALQERIIRPVGGEKDIAIDVRIISATNRNLKKEVLAQSFREDLFYRLNVINISLPPLRERSEDIPLLTRAILEKISNSSAIPAIAPKTMQMLVGYSYPGNVRELENILERALVLGDEVILPEHLPEALNYHKKSIEKEVFETQIVEDENLELPVDLDLLLSDIEKRYLEIALVQTSGVKKKAAELLGLNFRSFRYRLQKFDMNDQ